MGFKASTGDVHPGTDRDPRDQVWANGPNAGKTLAEAPRKPPRDDKKPQNSNYSLIFDKEASEQEAVERRWSSLDRRGYLAVQSKKLGLQKQAIDVEIELRELQAEYPAAFPQPGGGRPRWFYPVVVGFLMSQALLLLVIVAHVTRRPTPSEAAVSRDTERAEVAPAPQGRVAVARKGGR